MDSVAGGLLSSEFACGGRAMRLHGVTGINADVTHASLMRMDLMTVIFTKTCLACTLFRPGVELLVKATSI